MQQFHEDHRTKFYSVLTTLYIDFGFGSINPICAEFHRVTNVNLKNRFFAQLDQHTPRLQSLFRKKASRTGKASELLDQLFKIYDLQDQVDVHVRRAAVLRALPSYMHESDVSFFKMWDVEQSDEPDINDVPLGLLLSNQTSSDACFFCPERIAVLIEDNIVIESSTLADAFIILFALTYILHLNYPKQLLNTFDFVQKVLMGLEDGKLRPRVMSLKNDLLAVLTIEFTPPPLAAAPEYPEVAGLGIQRVGRVPPWALQECPFLSQKSNF
ncbi:hypothetical protein Q8A67_010166 [Cirrhinus molitorella]|uniref:Uncharacterized protein n=1 Tax=Cirrhinus molitorella TaxID=172907 RepID=A0AA88PSD6_9TELE|nr:hypothetical protein Q8A67_010166 [Cirrhinus molitorella]